MTGTTAGVFMKETVAIITEDIKNVRNITKIMVIIADRDGQTINW
jgi:hypothetical protein